MRKKIIAANWKMHKTVAQTTAFLQEFQATKPSPYEIWVAPPFTSLFAAAEFIKSHKMTLRLGGQNMHESAQGAFTGEVSGAMLKEAGATFCIIGHSERRSLFHETDDRIHAKVKRALEVGLTPLLCIGEQEAARDSGEYMEHLELQLASALEGLDPSHLKHLCLAYEPVWAIGTGRAATPQIAQETQLAIRTFISKKWGAPLAAALPILYGGSVNVENASSLLAQPDIDGALIGGASLEAKSFLDLLRRVTA